MKVLTAAQMREADRLTTERYGIPGIELMENAGAAIAEFLREKFAGHRPAAKSWCCAGREITAATAWWSPGFERFRMCGGCFSFCESEFGRGRCGGQFEALATRPRRIVRRHERSGMGIRARGARRGGLDR